MQLKSEPSPIWLHNFSCIGYYAPKKRMHRMLSKINSKEYQLVCMDHALFYNAQKARQAHAKAYFFLFWIREEEQHQMHRSKARLNKDISKLDAHKRRAIFVDVQGNEIEASIYRLFYCKEIDGQSYFDFLPDPKFLEAI